MAVDGAVRAAMPSISGNISVPKGGGYTPQKGIDYWTEEDRAEMIADMAEDLGLTVVNGKLCAVYEEGDVE